MATVSYGKNGSVSKKSHATKPTGNEHSLARYAPIPALGTKKTAPDHMTRRMSNSYAKTTKKMPMMSAEEMHDMGGPEEMMD
jgi:hypothetical protein